MVTVMSARNLDHERDWTHKIGRLQGVPVDELIALSEQRAGTGDVRDLETRDFGREALEELADTRNYLLWWMEQIAQSSSGSFSERADLITTISRALGNTASAFDHAIAAQTAYIKLEP